MPFADGGIVEQPNLKGVLDRRKRLCLPQQGEYAYMATAEAMRNAGIDEAYLAANEVGIIYGNDSSAAPVIEGIDSSAPGGTRRWSARQFSSR